MIKISNVEGIPIRLERGEATVLFLANRMGLDEVLVVEISARTAARLLDLTPRGTVFVLLRALQMREIDLDEFLDLLNQMKKQGFRLREEVYVEVVRKARRIMTET